MKKQAIAFTLSGLLLLGAATASNAEGKYLKISFKGPAVEQGFDGYLAYAETNGDAYTECLLSQMDGSLDDSGILEELAYSEPGALRMGYNYANLYQCNDQSCSQKTSLGSYSFNLSGEYGHYRVTPNSHTFYYGPEHGKLIPCKWDDSKVHSVRHSVKSFIR